MKIVEIIPFLYPIGGAERLVLDMMKYASTQNDDELMLISLYTRNKSKVIQIFDNNPSVKIVFLDKKKGIDLDCSKRLKKTINDFKPDIIHCHLDTILTIWFSGINKTYKTFFTFHTLINKRVIGNKHKPKNVLYRHLFRKKKIIPIAISKTIKESICDYYNLNVSDVPVVENGVPIDKYFNNDIVCDRQYDFIYIGRFIPLKNPDAIVRAFSRLSKDTKNLKLVMLGDGPLLAECKNLSEKQENTNILFTGFVDDVSVYLKKAKVLLLASSYEGNPMVVNEAIASKCFVVATNVGGIPDVVQDNVNGVLINYDEQLETSLAKTMGECLSNMDSISKKLNDNYDTNRSMVSIEKTWYKYKNIFKETKK